jgi:exopolysaccharide biosynthesis polyprenyl glycosylphosphotransferase
VNSNEPPPWRPGEGGVADSSGEIGLFEAETTDDQYGNVTPLPLPQPLGSSSGDADADRATDLLDSHTLDILSRRRPWRTNSRTRGWLVRRALLFADVAGLSLGFTLASVLFSTDTLHDRVGPGAESILFICSLPVWVVAAHLCGLYDRDGQRTDYSTVDDLMGVFTVVTVGAWLFTSFALLTGIVKSNPSRTAFFWAASIALVVLFRVIARTLCKRSPRYVQNTIVVGAGDVGQLAARKILNHPEYGLNLVGFIDPQPRERRDDLDYLTILGAPEELPDLIHLLDVERVIFAFSGEPHHEMLALIRALKALNVQVDVVPRLFEIVGPKVRVHTLEGLPLVGLSPSRLSPLSSRLKRTVDFTAALGFLVVTAPLFAYIAYRIRRDSPGPVLFRQTRLGQNMQPFTTLKFRSMRVDADQTVHREHIKSMMSAQAHAGPNGLYKLDRSDTVTPFGAWLRKTSLDELPQFVNVLRGDMSLVGPRPCIPYETESFLPHHFERFLVPAGLTGMWQVTARAYSSFGEALEMDVTYARGWSFGLDLRLLLLTPVTLLRRQATT